MALNNMGHSSQIVCLGRQAAGKTTFLARLVRQLEGDMRYSAIYDPDQFKELLEPVNRGEFPATTDPRNPKFHEIDVYLTDDTFKLRFLDIAGECYDNFNASNCNEALQELLHMDLAEYLSQCGGFLILLDTQSAITQHYNFLTQLTQKLRPYFPLSNYRRLPFYMAICFSKIDASQYRKLYNKPEEIAQILLKDTVNILRAHFEPERVKWFTTSVVGLPEGLTSDPSTTYAEDKKTAPNPTASTSSLGLGSIPNRSQLSPAPKPLGGEAATFKQFNPHNPPYNVVEPVSWLLDQIHDNPPDLSKRITPGKSL